MWLPNSVQLKGTNRAWTDPQGPPSPHRQVKALYDHYGTLFHTF